MSDQISNNKRIAKNTIMLYIRMLLTMAVSLYTSRVVLRTLGVIDYGVYDVVGGIVVMFSFLNSSMSGATSRFLTYELGRNDSKKLTETFNMALYEHILIAMIIMFFAETLGLWFLNNKLVIPAERLNAAHWVFHLSILSMFVTVTQVPYNASIISHEKMDIFAYIEMLNVVLKLLIVYFLQILNGDKLIIYAILVLTVTTLIAFIYRFYCIHHFPECRIKRVWNTKLLKSMLSFSGWDLYGNLSVSIRTQGVSMLLNMFFGAAINAASGIANQVQSAVMSFANNVLTAVKPQIIKYYAQGNTKEMVSLISNTVKLNFLILLFVSIPLMIEIHYVLSLWLTTVPAFTTAFCTFTLLFNLFANMSAILVTGVHATGKIIRPSVINGTLYILVIPFSYLAFKSGSSPWMPFLINVIVVFLGMISNAYTLKLYIDEFHLRTFLKEALTPCLLVFGITYSLSYLLSLILSESFIRLCVITLFSSCLLAILGYFFLIPRSISKIIFDKIKHLFLCKKD